MQKRFSAYLLFLEFLLLVIIIILSLHTIKACSEDLVVVSW